ncbi:uncharacterized protein LOC135812841 [Sycon ciliatum]|uniref:uncharacterized protein LOC135812841 n=1 Tax=Sycon ciliatum TaxID=27933 RepID=UPI0031F5F7DA
MAARVVLLLTVLIGAIYFNAEPAKASPHNIVVKQASLASLYGSVTFNITGYDRFNNPQGTEKCNTYKFDNGTLNSTLAGTIADPICDSGYSPVPGLYGTCVVYYGKHGHVAVHGWALPKGTICSKLLGTVKYRDGDNGNKTFVQCNKYNFTGGHYVAAGANQSVLPVCENKYIRADRHIATCVHNSHKNPGAGWFVPEGLPCIPLKGNTTTPRDDTPTPQCLEYSIPGGKYLTSNSNANKARYSTCDTGYTNHPGISAVCTTLKDDDYAKFGWLLPDISSCLRKSGQRTCVFYYYSRLCMFYCLIMPILLYNCGLWTLSKLLNDKLDKWQRRKLRVLLQIVYPQRITNNNLYTETKQSPVSATCRRRMLLWFGHVSTI